MNEKEDRVFNIVANENGSFAQDAKWLTSDLTFGSIPANVSHVLVIQISIEGDDRAPIQFTLDGTNWIATEKGDSLEGFTRFELNVENGNSLNFRQTSGSAVNARLLVLAEQVCECDD